MEHVGRAMDWRLTGENHGRGTRWDIPGLQELPMGVIKVQFKCRQWPSTRTDGRNLYVPDILGVTPSYTVRHVLEFLPRDIGLAQFALNTCSRRIRTTDASDT